MKKILSFTTISVLTTGLFAQYMVSTTPGNSSVVLEDLTGIFCGYCPDGAKVADNIKATAPDKVVLVGNHAGGYAAPGNPSLAQFDLRTNEGTQIDGLSDPSGYPAGNVNRMVTSYSMKPGKSAMGRGSWGTVANQVLSTPSPANIAVEAFYYAGTQTIVINVEGYYTSNGNGSDYLTVAILQDNIDTYQSGASSYPARVQGSGLYRQMDVLRGYATGSITGDEITTTTMGTFFSRTYQYAVVQVGPDIAPVITDMKVAAWLADDITFSSVVTGFATPSVQSRAVGINEAASLENLNIYPNPFATEATLEFDLDAAQMLTINLYDVTGKSVQVIPSQLYSVGNHKINIEGNGLENGLYYVNIIAKDGIVTRRLVLNN